MEDVNQNEMNSTPRDDWSHRRIRMDVVLGVFLSLLTYIVLTGQATPVDQLVVPSLIAGVVAIIGAYVFGAVWDYRSFILSVSNKGE